MGIEGIEELVTDDICGAQHQVFGTNVTVTCRRAPHSDESNHQALHVQIGEVHRDIFWAED